MPRPQTVRLTYVNGVVQPDPNPVLVEVGDTLTFELVSPPDGEVTITMANPELFSAGTFKKGQLPVRVNTAKSTTYACELRVNGSVVPQKAGTPGGSIDPATGDGGAGD